jgi:hypothetical protein
MSSPGSVSHWFEAVRRGDSLAAQKLWERYFPHLVRLAREKIRGAPHVLADEEDVALLWTASFTRREKVVFPIWRIVTTFGGYYSR